MEKSLGSGLTILETQDIIHATKYLMNRVENNGF